MDPPSPNINEKKRRKKTRNKFGNRNLPNHPDDSLMSEGNGNRRLPSLLWIAEKQNSAFSLLRRQVTAWYIRRMKSLLSPPSKLTSFWLHHSPFFPSSPRLALLPTAVPAFFSQTPRSTVFSSRYIFSLFSSCFFHCRSFLSLQNLSYFFFFCRSLWWKKKPPYSVAMFSPSKSFAVCFLFYPDFRLSPSPLAAASPLSIYMGISNP